MPALVLARLAEAAPARLEAQATGVIRGVARLTADSVARGALVVLRDVAGHRATAGPTGTFELTGVAPGSYVVVATIEGRQPGTVSATVRGGDTVEVTLLLGPPVQMAEVTVTAPRTHRYVVDSVSGASKIPVPILKMPQSVEVVTHAVLEDRAITDFRDLPANVSGVIANAGYLGGGLNDLNYVFRGLPSSYTQTSLRDGFRDFSGLTPRDLASVDRVEFLKGPSSVLYGSTGALGGLANTITKRPLADFRGEADVSADNFGALRAAADLGGPFSAGGGFGYRFNAAVERNTTFRDYSEGAKALSVAPVVGGAIGRKASLMVTGEYNYREFRDDPYLPMYEGVVDLPVSNFYGEPGLPLNTAQGGVGQAVFSYQFNPSLRLREGVSYASASLKSYSPLFTGVDTAAQLVLRTYGWGDETSWDIASQTEFYATFRTGSLTHQGLVGLELSEERYSVTFSLGDSLAPISLYHPVYGAVPSDTGTVLEGVHPDKQLGFYLEDILSIGTHVTAVLGARWDANRTVQYVDDVAVVEQNTNHVSPRVGVVYQPLPSTSLYGAWTQSFFPNLGCPSCGDPPTFPPELGQQLEFGLKQEFARGRFSYTLAWFNLVKSNLLGADPTDTLGMRSAIIGQMRSRGIEFDAAGSPVTGLRLIAAYAYTDAEVTEGNSYFPLGSRPANVPFNRLSFWATYAIQGGVLRGLAFGGGTTAQGQQYASLGNPFTLRAWLTVDAMVGYDRPMWSLQVNLRNITNDRGYLGVGDFMGGGSVSPNTSRAIIGSASYRF